MPKLASPRSALAVQRETRPGLHAVGGAPGLMLRVAPGGSRQWVLRVRRDGRRLHLGLGGFPTVTLAQAREAARALLAKLRQGIDPLAERRAARAATAALTRTPTFKVAAEQYVEAHSPSWRNPKHVQQWRSTLAQYADPIFGSVPVADVTKAHVLAALQPIWTTKTETAKRLRGRIEQVLAYAMQAGWRPEGVNPAAWRGGLDKLLAAPAKVAKVEHHPALPIDAMPAFMARLRQIPGMGARALEFVALTAARSGEVRGATWAEIDLDAATWTVPGSRMKAGKEHRVPLSDAALALLRALPRFADTDLVFPSVRGGRPLSDMTLLACMRRMGLDAVPHGLRSTFRDWCAEHTGYPREVAEMALAHAIPDAVEAAYRRGDLFDKRRRLMADWAKFLV
jgi:integrase